MPVGSRKTGSATDPRCVVLAVRNAFPASRTGAGTSRRNSSPWQHHDVESLVQPHWTDHAWRIFWLAVCVGGIWAGIPRRALFLCACLLLMVVPVLLVHSGYIMYNISARFPLYLFYGCAACAVGNRLHERYGWFFSKSGGREPREIGS